LDKIVIRVDGNLKLGLGHIYRMIAFAEIISPNFEIIFALNSPIEIIRKLLRGNNINYIDISKSKDEFEFFRETGESVNLRGIVLDGYHFDAKYQKRLKELGYKIISIDGIYSTHFYSDAVINYNLHANKKKYRKENYTRLYLGTKYCFLRKSFLDVAKSKIESYNERKDLTIMFGGSDQYNLAYKTLKLIGQCNLKVAFNNINVIYGKGYEFIDSLKEYKKNQPSTIVNLYSNLNDKELIKIFSNTKLAIIPGGYSLYEIFSVGVPVITGYYVDNQIQNSKSVDDYKLGVSVGNFNKLTKSILNKNIEFVLKNADICITRQKKIIDGKQEERINNLLFDVCGKS
jgi:UDP-2,4-diacetamido-2,4,6-trideoxy-beta-L-altropyranose hydrolase